MKRTDYTLTGILLLLVLCIYHPVFNAEYFYTDEIVQLWYYRKGSTFNMFLFQGRNITDRLFHLLFSSIHTIRQITWLRAFSLAGWMVSIPVWYYLLKRVADREKLPSILVFLSLVYLVASPPFTICIAWASCMELFIANTAGLISGYFCYAVVTGNTASRKSVTAGMLCSLVFGLISLFTYQNGFGCFLLPFLLHFLAVKKVQRTLVVALLASCMVYVVYFVLFRISLLFTHIAPVDRTSVYLDPLKKVLFLFARPMNSAFHFTWVSNENGTAGFMVYATLFGGWLAVHLMENRQKPLKETLVFPAGIILLLMFVYLPSLLVKENYASHRTMLAFNMAVFWVVCHTILNTIHRNRYRKLFISLVCIFFACNAWYNFNKLLLQPVTTEYKVVRSYIEINYNSSISEVRFIRPPHTLFNKLYGITSSWDEFGVPSTYPYWVPEFFVKQVVLEKTGSRDVAGQLVVQHWLSGTAPPRQAAGQKTPHTLFVDVRQLLEVNVALRQ